MAAANQCYGSSKPGLWQQHQLQRQHQIANDRHQQSSMQLCSVGRLGGVSTVPLLSVMQVITSGALIMELAAVFVLGATILTYDYFSSSDSMSSIGYF
jgi:hypothetical protein